MDDVSYDDTRADSFADCSEEFDPKRLLVVVLKQSGLPRRADDLTDLWVQPAEAEGTFGTCDEPPGADPRIDGTRDAGGNETVSVWEISSAERAVSSCLEPFFDSSNVAKTALDVRQAHVEAWPDKYVRRQEHVDDDGAWSSRGDPTFDDLAFYDDNR